MFDSKVKVLVFPTYPVPNACDWYRHIIPFEYCPDIEYKVAYDIPLLDGRDKDGKIVSRTVNPEFLQWADVFLFVRYYKKEMLPLVTHLIESAKKYNKVIAYETDDLLHKVQQNTYGKTELDQEKRLEDLETSELILQNADFVTVTTEPLKEFYSAYTDAPIHVLPNCYDPKIWSKVVKPQHNPDYVTIGWAGGENHYHKNFSILAKPFNYLKEKYGSALEFAVMCQKNPNQDWFSGHTNPFNFDFIYHQSVSIEDYPQALADMNFDVGVVVVEQNEFSNAKSNIKWMEYSLLGRPTIASDVGPYHNTTAVLVDNSPESWIEAIENVMTNNKKYAIISKNSTKAVKRYNIKNHWYKWNKIYKNAKRDNQKESS